MNQQKKKVKFIKVENKLQKKAGFGEISDVVISRSESIILNNSVDFKEIAGPILFRLRETVRYAKENPNELEIIRQELIKPIMELKANGPMFKYELIGTLAGIMLSFLEHIKQMTSDGVEIIEAHERTLSLIVAKGMSGDGGMVGKQLVNELESACSRYYKKNPDLFISETSKKEKTPQ